MERQLVKESLFGKQKPTVVSSQKQQTGRREKQIAREAQPSVPYWRPKRGSDFGTYKRHR